MNHGLLEILFIVFFVLACVCRAPFGRDYYPYLDLVLIGILGLSEFSLLH